MTHDLDNTVAILRRTPAALDALLRDLPAAWTMANEGGDSASAFDVVGHLAHLEQTDWMPRVRRILEHGESVPFDAVDREGHREANRGRPLADLLDEFARLRAQNLVELQSLRLGDDDLTRCGRHPALGTVTLAQLLATWAAHDLGHLHQMSRIMAHQYREAVGPWHEYLGVMRCGAVR
jgi:hypothetical protein